MSSLAKRLARGDPSAFAELYDLCADRVHHYLTVRLGSREYADDVLQETFLRLARSRKRLRRVDSPIAYAFAVARNEAIRFMQQTTRSPDFSQTFDAGALFGDTSATAANADDAEFAAWALSRLSEERREIVELKIFAGLTFREIAEVTGLAQGTAATRYRAALEQMREWAVKELS